MYIPAKFKISLKKSLQCFLCSYRHFWYFSECTQLVTLVLLTNKINNNITKDIKETVEQR